MKMPPLGPINHYSWLNKKSINFFTKAGALLKNTPHDVIIYSSKLSFTLKLSLIHSNENTAPEPPSLDIKICIEISKKSVLFLQQLQINF
jgi:hypothetical protein